MLNKIQRIFIGIEAERKLQDKKWGEQNHNPDKWLTILGEEYGEVCKASLENNIDKYRLELIQTAAVSIAMIECLDRFNKGI